MKTTKKATALRTSCGMKKFAAGTLALAACLLAGNLAQAHLTYGNGSPAPRDFGVYSGLTNAVKAITNQVCTGNFGWADAADGILGDSHKGRAFRFRLNNTALVSLTVAANPSATGSSIGGLTPAFTIYSGLAAVAPFSGTQSDSDHDGSDASLAWRTYWVQQNLNPSATDPTPTDGCWNSMADFKIGGLGDPTNDFSQLTTLIYKGSAASTNSGGSVTGSFTLPAGDYTIIIGGNDIANKTAGTANSSFGIAATLTVTAPTLNIVPKVFLTWTTGVPTNWVLQSSASVNGPMWTTVTNSPVVVDGQSGFVLDRNGDQQYFRLNYVP